MLDQRDNRFYREPEQSCQAEPTLFKFDIDATEMTRSQDGARPYPLPLSYWAPTAREALAIAFARHRGTRGFLSVDAIDPMPTHVRLEDGDFALRQLSPCALGFALSVLAEQSGRKTFAEMRAFLADIEADRKAVSKRLIAEWRGEDTGVDLARALAVAAE